MLISSKMLLYLASTTCLILHALQRQRTSGSAATRCCQQAESASNFRLWETRKESRRKAGEGVSPHPRVRSVPPSVNVCHARTSAVGKRRRRGTAEYVKGGYVPQWCGCRTATWFHNSCRFTTFGCSVTAYSHSGPAANDQPGCWPSDADVEPTPAAKTREPRHPQWFADVRQSVGYGESKCHWRQCRPSRPGSERGRK